MNAPHHSRPLAGLGARRVILALGILVLAFAAVPSGASAAKVWLEHEPDESSLGYAGHSGERNFVTVELSGGGFLFTESGGPTISSFPTPTCQAVSPVQVRCSTTNSQGTPWENLHFELRDGDDLAGVRVSTPSILNGGGGADVLKGGSGPDSVRGDGDFHAVPDPGNDTMDGRGGADEMWGGAGTDTVTYAGRTPGVNVSLDSVANDGGPGEGDDVVDVENVVGSKSADVLTGNHVANVLNGGLGGDQLDGVGGADELAGGAQNDDLDGGAGADHLTGQAGADTLEGGLDDDRLSGGEDGDTLGGGGGADFMSGGDATDSVHYTGVTAPVRVTLADGAPNDGAVGEGDNARSDVEAIFGGLGNDRLVGSDGPNELFGQSGDDTLIGGASDDRLEGETGDDVLEGGYHADLLSGGPGSADSVDYGWHSYTDGFTGEVVGVNATVDGDADDGNHLIDPSTTGEQGVFDRVDPDVEHIDGSQGPDLLVGDADANRLQGAAGEDQIHGQAGVDVLNGQAGDDAIDGGEDADQLRGGDGIDLASYAGRTATVNVSIDDVANDGDAASAEGDNVADTIEELRGGSAGDLLIGNGLTNRLLGAGGPDVLDGRGGADTLIGGAGIDTISYAMRPSSVAVTLDGLRNDGADPNGDGISTAAEEGDAEREIENATGGADDDSLKAIEADATVNVLTGGLGDDSLDSRDGTPTVDNLLCGGGAADQYRADPSDAHADCETALP